MNWTGADLRASREALGLSQHELSALLGKDGGRGWPQSRLSECEAEKRRVPEWLSQKMMTLEDAQESMIELMLEALDGGNGLFIHPNPASYMNSHPGEPHIHAALQRTAAAWAVREYEVEHGVRPTIRYWGMDADGNDWPEGTPPISR